MVRLNRIYTKTGDDGSTGLARGPRRRKHDLRVDAYGTVDETNAAIGIVRLAALPPELDVILANIQNDLFDLGADLATPPEDGQPESDGMALRVTAGQVSRLEEDIDRLNADLPALRSFVLPGGAPAAAHLHVARTICRRAERLVVALADTPGEIVSGEAMMYINRLSDLLFVAARFINHAGPGDVLWVPGQNR
ncbi:MAG: cob(I)yrinic acid a,c-diamide adenosyltransferase [Chelatococcus sp.]|jgi:cob(I)alamin adenosyltransferase|uniref:cob(I)yrinic acid a,c-diamide adenosyltransferase n=1 Tax=unclassified Chelatococcus TaxID=2638111 RepID=UPI001BCEFBF8|nr:MULTISPECIES: cob(I)yrinic acid a,c-diamide adenosyltransferase [unclassified Chelatococcus]CAH1664124.1 Corrinoid adenosyltransferase [Hyphomicrobiales bacterium]MBS7741661.1 cob(I)yrinic acid a,c-diamide adenosyltransferase [Chelatococcus sp. HY11]MBX3536250.1 cob(I)yrinic acid a,c-diamide adenosyltransferase [Chelatococcus sp.]MBX3544320.1 cob(I)yrinic acid a,c-diamide adenosyltransferase [Chelatococcus sp.]MCO5079156.1 cob(I)yrinic acid a,c-diamide adenosyltransferase [Chelatococcus sp.